MKNKIIYFLLIIIVVEGLFLAFRPNLGSIRTDSGWDSDYGGSDWGSDWDSDWDSDWGSDWDDDWDDDRSSSRSYSSRTYTFGEIIVPLLFLITIIILIVVLNSKQIPNNRSSSSANLYKDIDDELLLQLLNMSSYEELKKALFKVFVDVQNAWMEFDYDALSKLCGDELYNNYKSDLEVLKLKNGKNIMSDYNMKSMAIYRYLNNTSYIDINVCLSASFYDYVINTKTNEVIRGNKNNIMNNTYLLVFRKNITKLDKCPSCGAPVSESSNQKCEHCGNLIINNNSDFILISKGRI